MGRLPPNLGTRETKSQFRDSGYNDAGRSHITETWDSPRGDDQFLTLTLNQCRFKYSSTWYTTHEILTKTSIILSLLLLRRTQLKESVKLGHTTFVFGSGWRARRKDDWIGGNGPENCWQRVINMTREPGRYGLLMVKSSSGWRYSSR